MDIRVARLKSPAECESFAQNARERGAPELADQARKRAVQLRAEVHGATTEVERECLEAVYAYEEVLSAAKGKRQPANRTWQMIHRHGVLPAVERIVTKRAESAGYTALAEMGLLDMAFEAVVLRHPSVFSDEAIARSRERMKSHDVKPITSTTVSSQDNVNQDDFSTTLERYSAELTRMLDRFRKSPNSMHMGQGDEGRFREIGVELIDLFRDELVDGRHHAKIVADYFNDAVRNYTGSPSYRGVENVRGVVHAVLARVKRSPGCLQSTQIASGFITTPERVEALYRIGERFHLVAKQLRVRRQERPTLDIDDEYDVQDLFHALLRIPFDDVRPEEWSPSYAGGASRIDFLLPEIEAVVEIKKSRSGLGARELGEQLIVDIVKYKKHPNCRTLFCFVYDPDGRIANPRGIENDLNANQDELTVRVLIAP